MESDGSLASMNEYDRDLAEKYASHISYAKLRIATFDQIDGKDQRIVPLAEQLGDIAIALDTAFLKDRWDFVADALVMLSQCSDATRVQGAVKFNTFVR